MKFKSRPAFLLSVLALSLACGSPPPKSGGELALGRDDQRLRTLQEAMVIETDYGEIVIKLVREYAPAHVDKIRNLAQTGFYDGTTFHYIDPHRLIQGGDINSNDNDPTNDGTGDPGFTLQSEIRAPNLRGSVGLAHPPDEPNKGNSQFYICLHDLPTLNGRYTVFGQVTDGMNVVERIAQVKIDENGHPLERVVMKRVYLDKRKI